MTQVLIRGVLLYLDPLQLELCFAESLLDLLLLLEFLFTASSWDIYVCRWCRVRGTHWKVLFFSSRVFCSHVLNESWKYRLFVTVKPASGQWKVNLFLALHNYAAWQLRTTVPSDSLLKTYEKLFNVRIIQKKKTFLQLVSIWRKIDSVNDHWVPLKNIFHVLVAGFGKICLLSSTCPTGKLYASLRCFKFRDC